MFYVMVDFFYQGYVTSIVNVRIREIVFLYQACESVNKTACYHWDFFAQLQLFHQLLQTFGNEPTVLNFVPNGFFTNISSTPCFYNLCQGDFYHDLMSAIFCLTVPKFSVSESFSVSEISVIEKLYGSGGWGITIFRRINKIKIVAKCWDICPYPALHNPVVLRTVPWEQSEFPKSVSES